MSEVIVGILFAIIIFGAGWLILFYNKMINLRTRAEDRWRQICSVMGKRNHLLGGYLEMLFEKGIEELGVLTDIVLARARLMNSETLEEIMKSSKKTSHLLRHIFLLCTEYPEFEGNPDYVMSELQLKELEEKLEVCRYAYNEAALSYNKYVAVFPNNMASRLLGVEKLPLFQTEDRGKVDCVV